MMESRHVPPQNVEAEMSVLGSILLDNASIDTVHTLLARDDFYRESHRKIFSAMTELSDKNEPVDLITVVTALKKKGELEEAGGGAFLAGLTDYTPTSANVSYYCRIVKEKAIERRVLTHAGNATNLIYQGESLDQVVGELEAAINQTVAKQTNTVVSAKDAVRESIKGIEYRYEHKGEIGMPSGLLDLDKETGGFHRGDLVIVAGRPSMGKTTLALNILESICSKGLTGMLFSLEMSRQNNIDKILASQGQIPYDHIRFGTLRDGDWGKLTAASGRIFSWPFWIDDTPGISFREIRSKARRQKKTGLDVLVVDYLQLMAMLGKESRTQELGEISRGLKLLARELDMCVVALSQLNRAVDSRPDKRPLMSDLRDSGEIEQDADVILFPFRPAAYCQKCKDRIDDETHNYADHQAEAEVIIEKQRNGDRNLSIPVVWQGRFQRFVNEDHRHPV